MRADPSIASRALQRIRHDGAFQSALCVLGVVAFLYGSGCAPPPPADPSNGNPPPVQPNNGDPPPVEPNNVEPPPGPVGPGPTGQVATPTFSPNGGSFTSAVDVRISCGTSAATIRYTTDGSTPTALRGTVYSLGAVHLTSTTVLKAIAYKSDMMASKVGEATFVRVVQYTLTVKGGTGSGVYDAGQVVPIDATVPAGSRFDKWTGDTRNVADPNAASTTVTMNAHTRVTATFVGQYTLTVNGGRGSGLYDTGTVVPIEATVPPGSRFDEWTGDTGNVADPNAASTTVTMNAHTRVTATFVQQFTLTVDTQGQGSVDPNDGTYDAGTQVIVQALPADGWLFQNWTGGPNGTANPLTLTLNGDVTLTAVFQTGQPVVPPPAGSAQAIIDALDPTIVEGGSVLRIGGSGLSVDTEATVQFGAVRLPFLARSDTRIDVIVPYLAPGNYSVSVVFDQQRTNELVCTLHASLPPQADPAQVGREVEGGLNSIVSESSDTLGQALIDAGVSGQLAASVASDVNATLTAMTNEIAAQIKTLSPTEAGMLLEVTALIRSAAPAPMNILYSGEAVAPSVTAGTELHRRLFTFDVFSMALGNTAIHLKALAIPMAFKNLKVSKYMWKCATIFLSLKLLIDATVPCDIVQVALEDPFALQVGVGETIPLSFVGTFQTEGEAADANLQKLLELVASIGTSTLGNSGLDDALDMAISELAQFISARIRESFLPDEVINQLNPTREGVPLDMILYSYGWDDIVEQVLPMGLGNLVGWLFQNGILPSGDPKVPVITTNGRAVVGPDFASLTGITEGDEVLVWRGFRYRTADTTLGEWLGITAPDTLPKGSVAFYVGEIPQLATPAFDPNGGTFIDSVDVEMSCATAGATIRYTTDGSTPSSTHGTIYTAPIHLTETTTIKAIAYKSGMTDSEVASATFTINPGQEEYQFVLEWGSCGFADGQLEEPSGIAVDSTGNVYVTDIHPRVQKFAGNGTFLTKWGSPGSGDGQFDGADGIAVDSSGNVYLADIRNNRIQKFSSNGTFLAKWGSAGSGNGQFDAPKDVAVDSSGNIYVADYGNRRIQKFTGDGTFLTKWGSYGSGNGQFDGPYGIAVDSSGNVYAADTWNHRIQKFTSGGTFVTEWGSHGTGDGEFVKPYGVAVDSLGNVYVTDDNHRVQKFTGDGTFLTKWGSRGSGNGEFEYPSGVSVDSSGNVFVVDWGNCRVQKFAIALGPPGTVKWEFRTGASVDSSPAIGDDGTIYVGCDDGKLYAVYPDGEEKWEFTIGGAIDSSPAIGDDGTIYVGCDDGKLYAVYPDGKKKWEFAIGSELNSSPAIAADGTIYATSEGGALYAINPDGAKQWEVPVGKAFSPAIGSDGTIYVTQDWGEYMYAISPQGAIQWSYFRWRVGWNFTTSPVIGLDGTIYAAWDHHYLLAMRPDGTPQWKVDTECYDSVFSVGIGAQGTIYVASCYSLIAFNPDGSKWYYSSDGLGHAPGSPAIGADGTIYVAKPHRIFAITAYGAEKWYLDGGSNTSPALGPDGTVYFGRGSTLVAIYGDSGGLADDSPWPMFQHDLRHTGRVGGP